MFFNTMPYKIFMIKSVNYADKGIKNGKIKIGSILKSDEVG
jgi:hypothetical protein